MEDQNATTQSPNSIDGMGIPPVLPTPNYSAPGPTIAPNSPEIVNTSGTSKKIPPFVGGMIAVLLVVGGAIGSFYFTRTINRAEVPTAPTSKARASGCDITPPTNLNVEKISPTSVNLKWTAGTGGNYVKLWVSTNANPTSFCASLANKVTSAACPVNENGSLIDGDQNHADVPATPSVYSVSNLSPNTTYYWRMMMWSYSGCDSAAAIVSFKTDPACVDSTWTPDPATVCKNETFEQTSNCRAKRIIPGTKECVVTQACTDIKIYKRNADGNFSTTPMTIDELIAFTAGDTLRLTVKSSVAASPARFRVSYNGAPMFLPGPVVWPEAPNQRPAQGYVDTDTKLISYYDFTATRSGAYKFEGFVKAKP